MRKSEAIFLAAVLAVALLFAGISLREYGKAAPPGGGVAAITGVGGKSRDLDFGKVRRLIRQKQLSDREAKFYKESKAVELPP